MTDELDPVERRLSRRLSEFAETPFPARRTPDEIVARAAAAGNARASRNRWGVVLGAAAALAVAIGAATQLGLRAPGPPAATGTPRPATSPPAESGLTGMLHMTAVPAYDYRRANLAYIVSGTRTEGESIDQDVEIIVNRPFPPGEISVVKNDLLCAGTVTIVSGMETDVTLDFGQDQAGDEMCRLFTRATHPTGSIVHPELPLTASVGAILPIGVPSVFVVRSLDSPEAPPIAEVSVNESPWEAAQVVVQPGRYEVSVIVDGVVLGTQVIDLERGEDRVAILKILPPDVPRDCGEFAPDVCEAAIAEGYAWGLFTDGNSKVVAVSVRASEYPSCMGDLDPEWNVLFVLEPEGEIEVVVGVYPDGRLDACTY
jgi:hypothetical protein